MLTTLSIVSHNQISLVNNLLKTIDEHTSEKLEIIITLNTPKDSASHILKTRHKTKIIKNRHKRGFGENHNRAFSCSKGDYFCVMNPDIILVNDIIGGIVSFAQKNCPENFGVIAPKLLDSKGNLQDNSRLIPSPKDLFFRLFIRDYSRWISLNPDWVAGMFMFFNKYAFEDVGGFDEKYYMYCEDMDICCRLKEKGYKVIYNPKFCAIHNAQRNNRKNLKHAYWHAQSLFKFYLNNKGFPCS